MPTVMCVLSLLFGERVRLEAVIGWKRNSSLRRSSSTAALRALSTVDMLLVTSYNTVTETRLNIVCSDIVVPIHGPTTSLLHPTTVVRT